jgi:hypothetical protein
MPWSTVALTIGAPLEVPRTASESELEQARVELEQRLFGLEQHAASLLDR